MKRFSEVFLKTAGVLVLWALLLRVCGILRSALSRVAAEDAVLSELSFQLFALAALALVLLLFVGVIERGRVRTRLSRNVRKDLLLGSVVGSLWIGGTIGLHVLFGSVEFGEARYVSMFGLWIVAILINAITQEYLLHGYVFTLIQKRYGDIVAVSATAALFAALSANVLKNGTISILFLFLSGIFLALLRIYTDGLLTPILVRFLWNAVGCLVVGGVSFSATYPSVWTETLSSVDIISGGTRRFEGSGITLFVTALLIDLVVIMLNDAKESKRIAGT
ncbi:MAG: CPBP family intramembrane metalloprotease [Clostridiales Family XIII bacterium]|jgi:membrane protease YdiL (CAAX protease family)|nr:CPBP family intramembrane metalloprotease [Clostridiales Family XIII bacterium]